MRPHGVAVESLDGARTYAQLQARARAGARALAQRGAQRGDRVAIALPPGLAFAEALHACLLLGAVAVPVDLRLGPGERARVCQGTALVVEDDLAEWMLDARDCDRGAGAGARTDASAEHTDASADTSATDTDASADDTAASPDDTDTSATDTAASPDDTDTSTDDKDANADDTDETHDLDAVAAIIHTSGTTSAPRPIELTYGNFLWSALGSAVALDLDPRERWLCALPLAHVGGLSILVRSAIYATTAVVHPGWDTERVLDALRADGERGITLVSLVATTLARLLDAMPASPWRPPRLRWALTGGGPVPQALIARAHEAGVPVSTTYGLTEACSQVTTGGPPLFCTRVRIDGVANGLEGAAGSAGGADGGADGDGDGAGGADGDGEGEGGARDYGREGEILVAGPTVARGSRDADGWLHTGDLGVLDEHGNLRVTGRAADTIVSGGENVAPAEVEAALEAHPDVLEAAVFARGDATWGEAVTAIVVVRPGIELAEEALRVHCSGLLARYKVPKRFELSQTPLPRTRSGKLLRRELT